MQKNDKKGIFMRKVDAFLKNLDIVSLQSYLSFSQAEISDGSFGKSFYGRFKDAVMEAKIYVVNAVSSVLHKLSEQDKMKLRENLSPLTASHQNLLSEGIFSIKVQLTLLKQNIQKNHQLSELINSILQILHPLLFFYFVYKEYCKEAKKNSLVKIQENQQQVNNHEIDIDQDTINDIEFQLAQCDMNQLLDQCLKEEETKIYGSEEICKICGKAMQLIMLQEHIKMCSMQASLEEQLKNIQIERLELQRTVRDYQVKLFQQEISEKDLQAVKILKLFLDQNQTSKSLKLRKRSSDVALLYKRDIGSEINQKYFQFQQKYGDDSLINQMLENRQKSIIVKKKLHTIVKNNRIQGSVNSSCDKLSFKSLEASFSAIHQGKQASNYKSKRSAFAQAKQSIEESDEQLFDEENSNFDKSLEENKKVSLKLCKSINYLNCLKDKEKYREYDEQKSQKLFQIPKRRCKSMKNLTNSNSFLDYQMGMKDFEVLKFLGKGAFGKVYLVRRKQTGDLYALKHLKVKDKEKQKLQLVQKEHEIFQKIAGDHLIRAPFAFSEDYGHFFVLDFMPGGDLSDILSDQVYLEEEKAKFYLAEIILALEHLHSYNIIHRDLKPENLVIDKNGHLKLTDFGLSEININKKIKTVAQKIPELRVRKQLSLQEESQPKTIMITKKAALVNKNNNGKIIGTPDYIAPQIINHTSNNNKSIDWWSLGVMTYEMIVGCRPFAADTVQQVLDNIKNGKMQWPEVGTGEDMISPQAADLIHQLLNKDFQHRLGSNDIEALKNHKFFQGINWENIKNEEPPIFPKMPDLQKLSKIPQDENLRKQICLNNNEKTSKSIKLRNFIRYDLLLEETCVSAEKKIQNGKLKLSKLQSLAKNYSDCLQEEDLNKVTFKEKKMVRKPAYRSSANAKTGVINRAIIKTNTVCFDENSTEF